LQLTKFGNPSKIHGPAANTKTGAPQGAGMASVPAAAEQVFPGSLVMRCQQFRVALGSVAVAFSYAATMSVAWAQTATAQAEKTEAGRVEFDHPGGGEPAVQVDLPAGLWSDFVGLGDAAVAGVAEGLLQAKAHDEGTQSEVKLATDQLAAIRTIMSSLQGAVGEVRVRVYRGDDGAENAAEATDVAKFYAKKLAGSDWAKIVQVRDGKQSASVFLMRRDAAVRGVFVVANDGDELVLVNVLCDVSPERVKQITHEATKIGIEVGGEQGLHEILEDVLNR
jgi:hypothetical protein